MTSLKNQCISQNTWHNERVSVHYSVNTSNQFIPMYGVHGKIYAPIWKQIIIILFLLSNWNVAQVEEIWHKFKHVKRQIIGRCVKAQLAEKAWMRKYHVVKSHSRLLYNIILGPDVFYKL